ncbi:protein STAY-GREEN homolog, chloroplastic-like [Henckelia pumila]|uniref:protein STAY-GREEN homolog, chloroplastic-like n=1 Tax=Henckelia pumila TaxID=405737 RepID=UPI003C6DBC2A
MEQFQQVEAGPAGSVSKQQMIFMIMQFLGEEKFKESVHERCSTKKNQSTVPVARLFGPAIFEASKLKVLFVGVDEKKHPGKLSRTYTLRHNYVTSKLTLAISQTIDNSQVQ